MKKNIFRIVLLFVLTLPFLAFADEARAEECLSYEPVKVRLIGTIVEKTFPGPPEFESIEKGDRPETALILKLKRPVCVKGNPEDELNSETEKNVGDLHLVIHGGEYVRYRRFVTKQVVAEGTLFHAITGHHHTKVLMEVINIKPLGKENKK